VIGARGLRPSLFLRTYFMRKSSLAYRQKFEGRERRFGGRLRQRRTKD
jgi:hypothetical protein